MGKSPLRTVLRNFLDHYERLEDSLRKSRAAVKEMAESGRSTPPPLSLYAQEFLQLKELTESLKNEPGCPMVEGHSDVNKKKNRYKDILPYDNSRVILSEYPGVPGSDYINANYVRGSSGHQRAYIASQGPLPNTLVDFWRMIWETEVLVIVMACNEREAGKYKCEPYWPPNTEEKQQYGNITVEHVKWRQVCPDFLVRTFKVSADNEERTICQFHYTTWPDHGVPSSVQPIIELVRLMRDVQSTESRPILVHCSAGCGRTGTICSIDYVWALLRTGKLREDFSLHEIISDMRRQRIAMVQTVEQYMLCYKAVATLFEQHLKLIDSHTYENVDDDGQPLGFKDLPIDDEELSGHASPSTSTSSSDDLEKDSTNEDESPHLNEESINVGELCEEARPHEKLVGKATVIRRPSIAKLKAIFDNPQPSVSHPPANRVAKLQRSQSIKENFRNFNFNFHLEINQPKLPSRKTKSYTLSAAKLSVYKKRTEMTAKSSVGRTKITDISFVPNVPTGSSQAESPHDSERNENATGSSSEVLNTSDVQLTESKDLSYQPVISVSQNRQNNRFNTRPPSLNEPTRSAPPKPPRTYQHIMDDSCIIRTSEGRLIVTVAQPRTQKGSQDSQNDSESNYDQSDSIYEQLGARKYNISSPNLAISDQITFIPSGPSGSFHVPPANRKPLNYCDNNYGNANAIYSNPLISKSFPLPMYAPNQPKPNGQVPIRANEYPGNMPPAYGNYPSFVMNSGQHYQNHQAEPIMLPPGYYEPIYGSANHQRFPTNHQRPQISNPNIQVMPPPPPRPRSISSRLPNQIYGNREMCFKPLNVMPPYGNARNATAIITMPPKENEYSEINIKSPSSDPTVQNEINKKQSTNTDNNANDLKISKFNKFCKAFKMFRFKNQSPSPKASPPIKNPNTATSKTNNSNVGHAATVPNSFKVANGVPINPINGQPITRPPHSHRFQSATQWTQV